MTLLIWKLRPWPKNTSSKISSVIFLYAQNILAYVLLKCSTFWLVSVSADHASTIEQIIRILLLFRICSSEEFPKFNETLGAKAPRRVRFNIA